MRHPADDGSYLTKAIEDLVAGDLVLARDQYNEGDDLELKPVAAVFRKTSDHLRIVRIQDPSGGGNIETIQTTDEHPFYVSGPRIGWLAAKDLLPGDRRSAGDNSNDAVVLSTVREEHAEGVTVYNFEVEGDHTYFVEDGQGEATAVWVHNECAGVNHFVPRFLGSRAPKGSEMVGEVFHTHFHQKLRAFLSQERFLKTLDDGTVVSMVHRAGYGRKQIVDNFTRKERIRALVGFFREYQFGGRSFYDEFRSELKAALARGHFQ